MNNLTPSIQIFKRLTSNLLNKIRLHAPFRTDKTVPSVVEINVFHDRFIDWQVNMTGGGRSIEIPWMLRQTRNIEHCFVLDVGCVSNHDPLSRISTERYFLNRNNKFLGIDSRKPVKMSELSLFCQADAVNLPIQDETFDVVICISVLEHIGLGKYVQSGLNDKADYQAFMEMIRVLKRRGRLYLTVPFGVDMIWEGWVRSYTRERLDDMLRACPYPVCEEKSDFFKNTREGWLFSNSNDLSNVRMFEKVDDIEGLYCGLFIKN